MRLFGPLVWMLLAACASSTGTSGELQARLDNLAAPLLARNYVAFGQMRTVTVPEGDPGRSFVFDLEPGFNYAFLAACDVPCRRVHLSVHRPDGRRAGSDRPTVPPDAWWIETWADEPGRFTVTIRVLECDQPRCEAAFRGYSRRVAATP